MMYLKSIDDENQYTKIDENNIDNIEAFYNSNRRDKYHTSEFIGVADIWMVSTNEIPMFIGNILNRLLSRLAPHKYEYSNYFINASHGSTFMVVLYRYETRGEFIHRMFNCYNKRVKRQRRRIKYNAKARYIHSIQYK
jgi:hypothetical protein